MSLEQVQIDQLSGIAKSLDRIEALLLEQAKERKAVIASGGRVFLSPSTDQPIKVAGQ
jgi:shikimate kinase